MQKTVRAKQTTTPTMIPIIAPVAIEAAVSRLVDAVE
jgi:hypothetical protein